MSRSGAGDVSGAGAGCGALAAAVGLSATALRPPRPKLLGHRFLKGPCTPGSPPLGNLPSSGLLVSPRTLKPCGTLTRVYCPSMQGSPSLGRLDWTCRGFLSFPCLCSREDALPECASPAPVRPREKSHGEPRPQRALPAASAFVLSTTPGGESPAFHFAGEAPRRCGLPQVTHPGNSGGGAPDPPVCSPGRGCPPLPMTSSS